MRWMLAALILAMLAGCAQSDDGPTASAAADDAGTPPDDNPGADAPANGVPGDTDNSTPLQPTASLTADAITGPAPLTVQFLANGTDVQSWRLDANGDGIEDYNGTQLPQSIEVTFEEDGIFTANLTVLNGNWTVWSELVVEVQTPDQPAPVPEPIVLTGSITLPDAFAYGEVCIMPLLDFTGTHGHLHQIPSGLDQWKFSMEPTTAKTTFTNSGGDVGGTGSSGNIGAGMDSVYTCATMPLVDYTLTLYHPDWVF